MEELNRIADTHLRVPECGIAGSAVPDRISETPETLAPQIRPLAEAGWLQWVGGCCGTTPRTSRRSPMRFADSRAARDSDRAAVPAVVRNGGVHPDV